MPRVCQLLYSTDKSPRILSLFLFLSFPFFLLSLSFSHCNNLPLLSEKKLKSQSIESESNRIEEWPQISLSLSSKQSLPFRSYKNLPFTMATLHKFKLLATQCAVAGSPTRSPTTSPVIHLRRRRTLRMFLSRPERRRFARREGSSAELDDEDPPEMREKEVRVRRKLKDLFVSSPPPLEDCDKRCQEEERREQEGLLPTMVSSGLGSRFRTGSAFRRGGAASLRPVSSAFRYRFLKRAWRPVLVTIPE